MAYTWTTLSQVSFGTEITNAQLAALADDAVYLNDQFGTDFSQLNFTSQGNSFSKPSSDVVIKVMQDINIVTDNTTCSSDNSSHVGTYDAGYYGGNDGSDYSSNESDNYSTVNESN